MKFEHVGYLATLIIAFASLAELVMTGQADIREDLRALRAEMLVGQAELRAGPAELRAEMQEGQGQLRKEMQEGQGQLRKEMQEGQGQLREEMQEGQGQLREEMQEEQAELRKEMQAGQAELRGGQVRFREDLAPLGVRLAIVEHRTDTLESRLAATDRRSADPCEGVDCPGS